MKFLVTGAGGQLGREFLDYFDLKNMDFAGFTSKQLDITEKDAIEEKIAYHRPDVLINCAAYTKVDQAEDERKAAMHINRDAVRLLTQVCKKYSVKLVHFSTDYVFSGSLQDLKSLTKGYPEDYKVNPINTYGESKLAGEKAIADSGCEYLIIRVSWLCGKYGNNFVKTMLDMARRRETIKVVNDQWGSPTFAADVAGVTRSLLEKGEKGIFHFTCKGLITWHEFAEKIFQQAGVHPVMEAVPSTAFPTKARRPVFSKLNTQKIESVPGIEVPSWENSLQKLIESLKN